LSQDTLSEVLRAVRLTGAVFFDVEAGAPWVEQAPAGDVIASKVLPGVQHLISYHVVTQGGCWASLLGERAVRLEAGDVVVFPHGDAHVMSSSPGMSARPELMKYAPPAEGQLPVPVKTGGGGPERTHLVCGFLGCDVKPFNPLVAALPRLLHVRDRDGPAGGWLGRFIHLALAESRERRAGGESVLARLSELMFVEAIRRHLESLPDDQTGWLAGLRDPFVGRALAALHQRPTHEWSLAELAREAALSRSALADRFQRIVGRSPMLYLAQWRMQIAAGLLARGSKVASVAIEVGYDSEAAFSRAFKRFVGIPPATWRDGPTPPAEATTAVSASTRPASTRARRPAAARARTRTSRLPRLADTRR
jgi:AraC-like DNA-binding protein